MAICLLCNFSALCPMLSEKKQVGVWKQKLEAFNKLISFKIITLFKKIFQVLN